MTSEQHKSDNVVVNLLYFNSNAFRIFSKTSSGNNCYNYYAGIYTRVTIILRDKRLPAEVTKLPGNDVQKRPLCYCTCELV